MPDASNRAPAGEPSFDVCRQFPAEVLVITETAGLRMCVSCAASDVEERRERAAGRVTT